MTLPCMLRQWSTFYPNTGASLWDGYILFFFTMYTRFYLKYPDCNDIRKYLFYPTVKCLWNIMINTSTRCYPFITLSFSAWIDWYVWKQFLLYFRNNFGSCDLYLILDSNSFCHDTCLSITRFCSMFLRELFKSDFLRQNRRLVSHQFLSFYCPIFHCK